MCKGMAGVLITRGISSMLCWALNVRARKRSLRRLWEPWRAVEWGIARLEPRLSDSLGIEAKSKLLSLAGLAFPVGPWGHCQAPSELQPPGATLVPEPTDSLLHRPPSSPLPAPSSHPREAPHLTAQATRTSPCPLTLLPPPVRGPTAVGGWGVSCSSLLPTRPHQAEILAAQPSAFCPQRHLEGDDSAHDEGLNELHQQGPVWSVV